MYFSRNNKNILFKTFPVVVLLGVFFIACKSDKQNTEIQLSGTQKVAVLPRSRRSRPATDRRRGAPLRQDGAPHHRNPVHGACPRRFPCARPGMRDAVGGWEACRHQN